MKSLHPFILFLFSWILISSCAEKKKAEIPPAIQMKDFFRNPEKSGYQISPDGQYFSFRAPWKNRMNLFVQKVGDSSAIRVTSDTIRDIGSYFWKGDRLIYSRDINGDENFIVFSASYDGKDIKRLTPEKGVRAGLLDDLRALPGMESKVLIIMNQRNPQVFDPYICDVVSGDRKVLYDNSKDNFENWITDHTGLIRFATKTDGTDNVFYYRATEAEPFTEYMRVGYKDSWNPVLFTFDNKNLIVSHNLNGRDKNAIVEWDLAGKKETKLLQDNPDYDMGGVDFSRKRKVVTMYTWEGEKMEKKIIDEKTKKLFDQLEKKFPGYYISIVSENDDETKRTLSINSDRTSGRFYYHEDGKDEVTLLCDRTPWLKEEHMAEMKPISYISRDGLTIHGYLTLPVGREAKNLPVVVNPHGGPWA
ncbi:MAG: S9 family peptidase, partial [Bacteroidota bacterium]